MCSDKVDNNANNSFKLSKIFFFCKETWLMLNIVNNAMADDYCKADRSQ